MEKTPIKQRRVFRNSQDEAFAVELRVAAKALIEDIDDHRYGNFLTALKAFVLAMLSAGLFVASLRAENALLFITLYAGFFIVSVLLSVNTMHDAAHGALFRSRTLNALTARIVTIPLGIEPVYWQARHVRYHHPNANIEHFDLDTAANRFLRQTPFQPWSPQFRLQHLYWPVIAGLSMPYIGWVYDWSDRFGLTPLANDRLLRGGRGWTLFLVSKLMHFGMFVVMPLTIVEPTIGYGAVIAAYVLGQTMASCLLLTLILGTHWADTNFYDVSDGKQLPHSRHEHPFLTCCDWSPRRPVLGALMGGLNLHLTHHLFPTFSHRHYPALARIVGRLAARHGLPYRCLTYRELLRAQQSFLKSMGQRPDAAST